MSEPLEQLVFGWSETGLQGRNRLQAVATSEGWRRDDKYRRVARRLCRLDAAAGRDPIAFGWVDLGGRRFVFQRRMVPSPTGDARRLVAHVVAGRPQELPVELVLASFDSGFWWAGEGLDPVLKPVFATDIADGRTRPPGQLPKVPPEALLGSILAAGHGTPVAFDGNSREALAVAWAINRGVPGLLETLSFSTYESGQAIGWFDVVGIDGNARPRGALYCSRSATRTPYDRSQLGDLAAVVATASEELETRSPDAPKIYREVLRVAERTLAGKPEVIPRLVTGDRTLQAVLATEVGLRGVAGSLYSLDKQAWPRLRIEDEVQLGRIRRLAEVAANQATPTSEAALGAVARRLHGIHPRSGPAFVARVLDRRAAGERLPTPDQDFLAAAAAYVFETPVPERQVVALASWLEENVDGALLADRRLPDTWREGLFLQASAGGLLTAEDYADLAGRYPRLFEAEGWLPARADLVARMVCGPAPLRDLTADAALRSWSIGKIVALADELHTRGERLGPVALLGALGRAERVELSGADRDVVWSVLADLARAATTDADAVGLLEIPWRVAEHLGEPPAEERWIGAVADVLRRSSDQVDRSQAWVARAGADKALATTPYVQVALHDLALSCPADWAFRRALAKLEPIRMARALQARVVLSALERREVTEAFKPVLLFALGAAVTPTGFLRLRVTAGENDGPARAQVARLRAADPAAFLQDGELPRPVAKWLRRSR